MLSSLAPLYSARGPCPWGGAAVFWLGLPPQLTFSGNTHRDGPRGVSMVNSNPVIEGDVNIEGSLESDLGGTKTSAALTLS